jgi:hypothetical protein
MSNVRKAPDHVKAANLAVAIIKREPVGSPERNLARCYLQAVKAVKDLDGTLAGIQRRIASIDTGPIDISAYLSLRDPRPSRRKRAKK